MVDSVSLAEKVQALSDTTSLPSVYHCKKSKNINSSIETLQLLKSVISIQGSASALMNFFFVYVYRDLNYNRLAYKTLLNGNHKHQVTTTGRWDTLKTRRWMPENNRPIYATKQPLI